MLHFYGYTCDYCCNKLDDTKDYVDIHIGDVDYVDLCTECFDELKNTIHVFCRKD